ncbi:conserved hypothetical protein [Roseibium sp. TrichSKD4]|uniref:DUF1467 family protein n=1 Tax=Roseibium sp. TrichSKD4 TaxID=744980 RepID=UPI0001E566D8|nr:DUF1467 family protein [Roseibium sp. TrichSKD4]EFO33632.1 conserved hypothetical protein [Roseibium sp. TrichSKD4]
MSLFFGFAVYFMIWWIGLFAVLPFGIKRSQEEAGDVVPGSEPGAPESVNFKKVLVINTILATVLFATYYWLRQSGFSLTELPFPGPR